MVHLHIEPDVIRETADVQLGLLEGGEVRLVAKNGVVALRVVLDRGGER
jgi:hypothetical protein